MSQVRVIRDADMAWQEPPDAWPGKAKPGEPSVSHKTVLRAGPDRPNMQRVRYDPNRFEPPHSHPEDEVIYMLSGTLAFGDQILCNGDVLFVPKDARYSLRAGEAGAEFIRVGMPA